MTIDMYKLNQKSYYADELEFMIIRAAYDQLLIHYPEPLI